LEVRDFTQPDPFVDRAGADGEAPGELLLLDEGGLNESRASEALDGVARVRGLDGRCVDGGFHDYAPFAVSTHRLS